MCRLLHLSVLSKKKASIAGRFLLLFMIYKILTEQTYQVLFSAL